MVDILQIQSAQLARETANSKSLMHIVLLLLLFLNYFFHKRIYLFITINIIQKKKDQHTGIETEKKVPYIGDFNRFSSQILNQNKFLNLSHSSWIYWTCLIRVNKTYFENCMRTDWLLHKQTYPIFFPSQYNAMVKDYYCLLFILTMSQNCLFAVHFDHVPKLYVCGSFWPCLKSICWRFILTMSQTVCWLIILILSQNC